MSKYLHESEIELLNRILLAHGAMHSYTSGHHDFKIADSNMKISCSDCSWCYEIDQEVRGRWGRVD